ncbi:MAG: hypothetical protein ABSE25_06975 [Syntrophorhabdales bacterium]|jgi:molybdopterin converting factor small subunit
MTVELDSNFMLLGDKDLKSIDLDRPSITVTELLEEISGRSSNPLQFFTRNGETLDEGWEVEVNGCALAGLPEGLGTSLKDGDRVAIRLSLLGGG